MRKITKRSVAIVAAAVVGLGGAGAAWAAWTSTDTETVSATAGSAGAVVISAQSVVGPAVDPGNDADVQFTITNNNTYAVNVTGASLSLFTSPTVACDAPNTFEQSAAPLPVIPTIAAGGSAVVTWTDAVQLTANPDNDCQAQPYGFTIEVDADSV